MNWNRSSSGSADSPPWQQAIRREQRRMLLWAIPVGVGAYALSGLLGSFSDHPWLVALVLLPLLVAVVVLGQPLVRDGRLLLGGGFLTFFLAYCLLFSVAAATELLNGQRVPLTGYEDARPRNFLGLNRLEDWHYWLASSASSSDFVVVTLPSFEGQNPAEPRRLHAGLIRNAMDHGAKGIAFDYALHDTSEADRVLCFWIDRAWKANLPVFFGYFLDQGEQGPAPRPVAETLRDCLPPERLGNLTGYREADGRIRMVPLFRPGGSTDPSFSTLIARSMTRHELDLPASRLLSFTRPKPELDVIDGLPDVNEVQRFRNRFVLIGSNRPGDTHATPYGPRHGVVIHAYAAHSLLTGHFIRRVDPRWLFPIVFGLCYLLVALQARGGGRASLLKGALVVTGAVLAAAGLAIWFGLLWIDVTYPLAAIWVLTGALTGGASLHAARARSWKTLPAETEPDQAEATMFDVFLSHNSTDKPTVRQLGEALQARGLHVWLDEWELIPGRDWQQALEDVIRTVGSAAVLIGQDGLGPWEIPEMRACLDQCVKRKMPVIPVLLPGASGQPELPLFLASYTWVDLRDGLTDAGLDRLEWGITGIKPRRRSPA